MKLIENAPKPAYGDNVYFRIRNNSINTIRKNIVLSILLLSVSSIIFLLGHSGVSLFLHTVIVSFSIVSISLIIICFQKLQSIEILFQKSKTFIPVNSYVLPLLFVLLTGSIFLLIITIFPVVLFVMLSILLICLLITFNIIKRKFLNKISVAIIFVIAGLFTIIIFFFTRWIGISEWIKIPEWIRLSESIIMITDSALAIVLFIFLIDLMHYKPVKLTVFDEKNLLKEKIADAFDERVCNYHPSTKPDAKCPNCYRDICSVCRAHYHNFCVHCYRDELEKRTVYYRFAQYIGGLLLILSFIIWMWGNYAPLPILQRGLSWAGFYYSRSVLMFYYFMLISAIITILVSGGLLLSRQTESKIQILNQEISEVEGEHQ